MRRKSARFFFWGIIKSRAMKLSSISIILVEPENPDNIGSVARAMKNTGFSDLRLIFPPKDWMEKGKKLAVSAEDLLQSAKVFSSIEEAVSDTNLVVGTTRREGERRGNFTTYHEGLQKICAMADAGKKTAILFGKESKGLDNQTLRFCDFLITIPADEIYPSYNLAQAVLLITFGIFNFQNSKELTNKKELDLISKEEMQITLKRFEKAIKALGYLETGSNKRGRIKTTLWGMMKRSGLLKSEAEMFKGLSRRILEKMDQEK